MFYAKRNAYKLFIKTALVHGLYKAANPVSLGFQGCCSRIFFFENKTMPYVFKSPKIG